MQRCFVPIMWTNAVLFGNILWLKEVQVPLLLLTLILKELAITMFRLKMGLAKPLLSMLLQQLQKTPMMLNGLNMTLSLLSHLVQQTPHTTPSQDQPVQEKDLCFLPSLECLSDHRDSVMLQDLLRSTIKIWSQLQAQKMQLEVLEDTFHQLVERRSGVLSTRMNPWWFPKRRNSARPGTFIYQ